ncbi:MAG: hypothetical protein CTY35_14860 [Methylotenera sp.]|nr:MAG: hypothetical protein CTY35_14860 [Methylotenera sp.]
MTDQRKQVTRNQEQTLDTLLIQSANAYKQGKLMDAYELYKKAKILKPTLSIVAPTNTLNNNVRMLWNTESMQRFANWAEESIGQLIDKTDQSDNLDLFATVN